MATNYSGPMQTTQMLRLWNMAQQKLKKDIERSVYTEHEARQKRWSGKTSSSDNTSLSYEDKTHGMANKLRNLVQEGQKRCLDSKSLIESANVSNEEKVHGKANTRYNLKSAKPICCEESKTSSPTAIYWQDIRTDGLQSTSQREQIRIQLKSQMKHQQAGRSRSRSMKCQSRRKARLFSEHQALAPSTVNNKSNGVSGIEKLSQQVATDCIPDRPHCQTNYAVRAIAWSGRKYFGGQKTGCIAPIRHQSPSPKTVMEVDVLSLKLANSSCGRRLLPSL